MKMINDGSTIVDKMNQSRFKLTKAYKKLSTGNRINSAADDAAGLAISEKLRAIDRGLRQGQRNINDGISYLDTVDGCAQELHSMIHRMKELAVEAANDTNSRLDREALDLEYQQLIDEIGQVTDSAEFNGLPLFEKHLPEYEKDCGSITHDQYTTIDSSNSPLTIGYTKNGRDYECTVDIPAGKYTAEELADQIDTALWDKDRSLIIGVNTDKQLTMQCEGGQINYISGKGASLFYDTIVGNSKGYLLGITSFHTDSVTMPITAGANDVIEFRLGNTDDTKYTLKLDPGSYTRPRLVQQINEKIQQAGLPCDVEAVMETSPDGRNVIGLKSELTMTGLSGNFLKIDGISSPIYDIAQYSDLVNSEAELLGTRRLPAGLEIERGRNDYFILDAGWYDADGNPHQEKLRIDLLDAGENLRSYPSADSVADRIRDQLAKYDCPINVETRNGALRFTTLQYGKECKVKLDTSNVPSKYMVYDLFDDASLSVLTPGVPRSKFTAASLTCYKQLDNSIVIPENHNQLTFEITSESNGVQSKASLRFEIPKGVYSRSQLQTKLNEMLAADYPDFSDKLTFSVGSTLSLSANRADGWEIYSIAAKDDTAYSRLIKGPNLYDNLDASHSTGQEQALTSYTDTDPSTGKSSTTSTAGKTTPAVTYENASISRTEQKSDKLLYYSNATYKITPGTTTITPGHESEIGDPNYTTKTPAECTLYNVLTQFRTMGTSQRDIQFSFDVVDATGYSKSYSVTIPKGSTASQAIQKINQDLGDITAAADGDNLKFVTKREGDNIGFKNLAGNLMQTEKKSSLAGQQGAVVDGDTVYVPATMTVRDASSHIPLTVDGTNDRFVFTAGGHRYDLQLENRTYSSLADLAAEINSKISQADGGNPATSVKANGSSLEFTAPPKETGGISISNTSTCPLDKKKITNSVAGSQYFNPATGNEETPASITLSSVDSHMPLTIDSTNNTISMDYTCPDPSSPSGSKTERLTIMIPDGTYSSGADLTNAISAAIAADPALNGKITASYSPSGSSKGLTFTSTQRGQGCSLSNLSAPSNLNKYKKTNTTAGGTPSPADNKLKFPAYIQNTQFSTLFNDDGIEINDTNDQASFTVNGTVYRFKLTHGTYAGASGRNSLISQVNAGLNGSGVTVSDSGSTLKITTSNVGAGASILLNADNTSPLFKRATSCGAPRSQNRDYTAAVITGRVPISNIEIRDYYSEMTFDFSNNGISQTLTVSVPEGNYTADTLAAAIQASIDGQVGAGQLTVGVTSGKLTITAGRMDSDQMMSNFSGKLFDRVFQDASYTRVNRHTEKIGTTVGSALSFIVGRNNLEPETADEIECGKSVMIYTGLNDSLIFDFTYQGNTYTINATIPGGAYDPQEIADAVQKVGRESMSKMVDVNGDPLPADRFHATIGVSAIGASENSTGFDNSNKLVLSYIAPTNGTLKSADAIIDGVRGNAAYRLFYDATQSPRPSRIIGESDISGGVTITAGQNDTLSFDLDGNTISVTIPAGTYDSRTISDALNKELEAVPCLVRAVDNNGRLMFYTTENGAFQIDKFTGSASDDLFYGADKRETDDEIGIHYGRRTNSYIWYDKTRLDEHLMRINTTGVTTVDRALKAISRLDYANSYLSGWRAVSGAQRNRSEHAYSVNTTTIENLESADSALRDADIAKEVSAAAKQSIIMQAQGYIMNTQKENNKSILDILA